VRAARGDLSTRGHSLEFFTINIPKQHGRRADSRAVNDFVAQCEHAGVRWINAVELLSGSAEIKSLT
jgi:hypothetical protein